MKNLYEAKFGLPALASKKTPQTISDEDVKNQSIRSKIDLSLIFQPDSHTVPSKKAFLRRQRSDDNSFEENNLSSTLKVIMYGTGTGKTYGSVNGFIVKYDWVLNSPLSVDEAIKEYCADGGFENCVYLTPNKNQFKFDKNLMERMYERGITPISILAKGDIENCDFILWNGGKVTNLDRLNDYKKVTRHLISLSKKGEANSRDKFFHVLTLERLIKSIIIQMIEIRRIDNTVYDTKEEKELSEKEKDKHSRHLFSNIDSLIKACFNNARKTPEGDSSVFDDKDELLESAQLKDSTFEDHLERNDDKKSFDDPIDEDDVFKAIFYPALEKPFYDDLLSKTVCDCNDYEKVLATFKKDLLRIYAPLNFALYTPCFITMTTLKSRYSARLYRQNYRKNENDWVSDDSFKTTADLIGNKSSDIKPITYIESHAERVKELKERVLAEPKYPSPFANRDISFYVIIDEANQMFKLDMQGNLGDGSMGKAGVIKKVNQRFSLTDLLAVVSRKASELKQHGSSSTDCHNQLKAFFMPMRSYIDKRTSIDIEDIDSGEYLDFSNAPNIIYVDNDEAEIVTNIAKNAFSMGAKNFLSKKELSEIYVCKRGEQRYLSISEKNKDSRIMSLYDMYQLITSIFYAAFYYEKRYKGVDKDLKHSLVLDLNASSTSKSESIDRQNSALASLLTYAYNYKEDLSLWLEDIDVELDNMPVDDWFAYLQTKLLFSMSLNNSLDNSPDKGHQSKTFLYIDLHLITANPEINILKMLYNTKNTVHIMSATSGRYYAYSSQYNLGFLKKWSQALDINFSLPEYDITYDLDYRESFLENNIKAKRDTRLLNVVPYDEPKEIISLLPGTEKKIRLGREHKPNNELSVKKSTAYENLMQNLTFTDDVKNPNSDNPNSSLLYRPIYRYMNKHNQKAFNRAVAGLLLAMQSMDTTLVMSLKRDLTDTLHRTLQFEFKYKNKAQHANALENAIKQGHPKVTFKHSVFGSIQLPILNNELERLSKLKKSEDVLNKICRKAVYDLSNGEYNYVVDLFDLDAKYNVPFDKVIRLVLFNSDASKKFPNIDDYFEIKEINYQGRKRTLYTTIVSYFAAAAVGINNTIKNKIHTPGKVVDEDINRLFIASTTFWSVVKNSYTQTSRSRRYGADDVTTDVYNNMYNVLFFMRYYAENPDQDMVTVSDFDSNLSSKKAIEFLKTEHLRILVDDLRQMLGRIERLVPYCNFKSEIFIPQEELLNHTKTNINMYDFEDEHYAEPMINNLDYDFMSYNNRVLFETGLSLLNKRVTTNNLRRNLHSDTKHAHEVISGFTGPGGLIRKVLKTARSGDEPGFDKALANAAIEFNEAYRKISILLCPHLWKKDILKADRLNDGRRLSQVLGTPNLKEVLDLMYVDKAKYLKSPKSNPDDLELYVREVDGVTVGLTDFLGSESTDIEPYNPFKYTLSPIDKPEGLEYDKKNLAGSRFEILFKFTEQIIKNKGGVKYSFDENNPVSSRMAPMKEKQIFSGESLVLHPAMLHMALGNAGESLFDKFLKSYDGGYIPIDPTTLVNTVGYQFYEMFDFWMRPKDTSSKTNWICIDVKNFSKRENIQQTKRLLDSKDRKFEKFKNDLYIGASQQEIEPQLLGMDALFKTSNHVDFAFINIRSSKESEVRDTVNEYTANFGTQKVTVKVHFLTLFINVLFLEKEQRKFDKLPADDNSGKKKDRPKRRWVTTINPKVLKLLNMQPDTFISDSIRTIDDKPKSNLSSWDQMVKEMEDAARELETQTETKDNNTQEGE